MSHHAVIEIGRTNRLKRGEGNPRRQREITPTNRSYYIRLEATSVAPRRDRIMAVFTFSRVRRSAGMASGRSSVLGTLVDSAGEALICSSPSKNSSKACPLRAVICTASSAVANLALSQNFRKVLPHSESSTGRTRMVPRRAIQPPVTAARPTVAVESVRMKFWRFIK